MTAFTESTVEVAALAWLEGVGWGVAHGPDIAPDMPAAVASGSWAPGARCHPVLGFLGRPASEAGR